MSEPRTAGSASLVRADPVANRAELIELNVEYLSWVFAGIEGLSGVPAATIVGMPVAQYVPTIIGKVCGDPPPRGIFYLIRVDGRLAGMGGLRYLWDGAAEIKRLYIRPQFRGMQLGASMLERLLTDAASFGYGAAYLDTAPFMGSAQRLYELHGFVDCAAYPGVEVPSEFHRQWRFMQRKVSHAKQ
jgi:GNAT superfamily N-acetyltransferase